MMNKADLNSLSHGWFWIALCFVMSVVVAGCAGSTPQSRPGSMAPAKEAVLPDSGIVQSRPPDIPSKESQLRAEVRRWQGTPHKMGGASRRGVDCSGFVQHLYRAVYHRSIPRSTALQVQSGRSVALNQLSPGDLIFFKPPYKIRHVGIYLGEGQFAHASASKGVMISNLSETYWRECYWTARRYLPYELN
jgi:cell wall-associated NlpC family hydrolase